MNFLLNVQSGFQLTVQSYITGVFLVTVLGAIPAIASDYGISSVPTQDQRIQERIQGKGDRPSLVPAVHHLQMETESEETRKQIEHLLTHSHCSYDAETIDAETGPEKGNAPLTRAALIVLLNHCISEKIPPRTPQSISPLPGVEQLEALKRQSQNYRDQIEKIQIQISDLESRIDPLEDDAFFKGFLKLSGTVIVTTSVALGEQQADEAEDLERQATLGYRSRFRFDLDLPGNDRLRVGLQAANLPNLGSATGTDMARLAAQTDTNNQVDVEDIIYRRSIGDRLTLWVGANEFAFDDMADLHNPLLSSSSLGAVSRFSRRNPAVFRNGESQGIGANVELGRSLTLDLGYVIGDGSQTGDGGGIFTGSFTTIGQLNWEPNKSLGLGLALGYSFYPGDDVNLSGSTGSSLARRPFGQEATSALRVGFQGDWEIGDRLLFSGWLGYVQGTAKSGDLSGHHADIWTWSANLGIRDLGKKSAFLAIATGMPPKATRIGGGNGDPNTSYIIEVLYRYPLQENLFLTPGGFVILSPEHDSTNDPIWVLLLQTSFSF